MKKLLLLIITFFLYQFTSAQAIVSDPKLLESTERKAVMDKASFAKQLEESVRIYNESKTTREKIEEGLKKIEHVSSYVQNSQQVLNIKKLMSEITREYSNGFNFIRSQPVNTGIVTASDIDKFSIIYTNMLAESVSDLKSCMNVVNTGFFNMDDAARLAALERIEGRLNEKRQLMSYLNNKIKKGVQTRKTLIANKKAIAKETFGFNKKKE